MKNCPNFVAEVRKNLRLVLFSAHALAAQAILTVTIPIIIKFFFDELLLNNAQPLVELNLWNYSLSLEPQVALISVSSLLLALAIFVSIADYLEEYFLTRTSQSVITGLRRKLTTKLLTRKVKFFEQQRSIDILGRYSGDITNLEILVVDGLKVAVRSIPTLILVTVTMLSVNYNFALLLTVTLGLMYFATSYFSKKVRIHSKKFRSETNRLELDLNQGLVSLPLIKALSLSKVIENKLHSRTGLISDSVLEARKSEGRLNATLSGSKNIVRAFIVLIGGHFVFSGQISLGGLVLFLSYIEILNKPINEIAKFTAKYAKASVSLERAEELFKNLDKDEETGGDLILHRRPHIGPAVCFDDVTFRYKDSLQPVIEKWSHKFNYGDLVALVGPSGAGKSTLMRLINRLSDPQSGVVTINSIAVSEYDLESLRSYVTYIGQEDFFISGTVAENIKIATDIDVSDDMIRSALSKVHALDFVNGLTDGIDTIIGEAGTQLSGGEQRRLSLARAFIRRESEIFIFDEPTSGLDPLSAKVVMNSIAELAKSGSAVFWITHNLDETNQASKVVFCSKNSQIKMTSPSTSICVQKQFKSMLHEAFEL